MSAGVVIFLIGLASLLSAAGVTIAITIAARAAIDLEKCKAGRREP